MKPLLLVLPFVTAALAGCLGDGETGDAAGEEAKTPALPSEVDVERPPEQAAAETGEIRGRVRDEAGASLTGAVLAVRPTGNATGAPIAQAASDKAGEFAFKGVPVGTYRVEAKAEGYDADVKPATVLAGKTANLEFVLKELITSDAFNVTTVYQGRMTCWAGATFTAEVECDDSPTLNRNLQTAGKGHANAFVFGAGPNATEPVPGRVFEVWVEARWQEVKASDEYAYPALGTNLVLENNATAGGVSGDDQQETSPGHRGDEDPPAKVIAQKGHVDSWGMAEGGFFRFHLRPGSVYETIVLLDIAYEAHATVFYNGPPDPCWSPMLGARLATEECK